MAICKNKKCSIGECDQTEGCAAYVPVVSNADRIRAMSDEELAASNYIPCPYDDDGYGECKYGWHKQEQTCEECKLEWLKQSAEE